MWALTRFTQKWNTIQRLGLGRTPDRTTDQLGVNLFFVIPLAGSRVADVRPSPFHTLISTLPIFPIHMPTRQVFLSKFFKIKWNGCQPIKNFIAKIFYMTQPKKCTTFWPKLILQTSGVFRILTFLAIKIDHFLFYLFYFFVTKRANSCFFTLTTNHF